MLCGVAIEIRSLTNSRNGAADHMQSGTEGNRGKDPALGGFLPAWLLPMHPQLVQSSVAATMPAVIWVEVTL